MPVYRKHRLAHIHIPKTGGTAIEQLFDQLDDFVWNAESWIGEGRHEGRWYEYQHLTAIELALMTGHEFREFEWFAVVRDPYQRLISDYLWRRSNLEQPSDSPTPAFDTFASFLSAIPPDIDTGWADHIAEADRATANFLIHVRPQHHYIQGPAILEGEAVRTVAFENLPTALDSSFSRWGIDAHPLRATRTHPMGDFFNEELLRKVNERYRNDFQQLGYPLREQVDR